MNEWFLFVDWCQSQLQSKDMGSFRGFSATRGTFVARAWHFRSKQERSAQPTISIQPCGWELLAPLVHSVPTNVPDNLVGAGRGKVLTHVGGFGFCIPAVTGVMSHLVVHVLPEAQLVFGDTNFGEVEVDPPDEVSQDGVIDDPLQETENENQRLIQCFVGRNQQNDHPRSFTTTKIQVIIETLTCSTASPSLMICADWPLVWALEEYNVISKSATLENLGWTFSFGSTKCSISAMVNSLK